MILMVSIGGIDFFSPFFFNEFLLLLLVEANASFVFDQVFTLFDLGNMFKFWK